MLRLLATYAAATTLATINATTATTLATINATTPIINATATTTTASGFVR